MRIGELAARTGVAARLLRYYEQQGLLYPARDEHGWRSYSAADYGRVRRIRTLIESGLPTAAIVELLGSPDADTDSVPAADAGLLRQLTEVRDRLDARIRCLAGNRDALTAWLDKAKAPERS